MPKIRSLSVRAKIVFITVSIMFFAMGTSTLTGIRTMVKEYSKALQSETLSIAQGLRIQLDRILSLGIDLEDIIGFEDISADMPHYLSEILGKVKGPDMVTIFSQGCSGDVDHNAYGQIPKTGPAIAEQVGYRMAGAVMKIFAGMKPVNVDKIKVKQELVQLPLAPISQDEVPEAIEISGSYGKDEKYPFLELVQAFKVKAVHERHGKPFDAEIQAFAFGKDVVLLSLPGEIFTQLGLYIKSRSLYENTIVAAFANDHLDYIPDRKAFIEGNYEPISSRCAPGSGEILAEAAIRMLIGLKTDLK